MTGQALQTQQATVPALRIADTIAAIKENVQMVQHVMREVMVKEVHYGTVPGTQKPSLLQPGAEIIALAFHWSAADAVEDLSYTDVVRYRVTCTLCSRETGEFVGSGQGEASSDEEKYRWRKAVCPQEYDETPESRRRTKWARGKGGSAYQTQQVRQEPADIANTVLKMASKRAFIAAVRKASGCSDMFAQDLEDLPAEVREAAIEPEPEPPIGEADYRKLIRGALKYGYTEEDVLSTAATLGHEGPGAEMPDDIARRLFAAMKATPRLDTEPEAGGYPTPLMRDE